MSQGGWTGNAQSVSANVLPILTLAALVNSRARQARCVSACHTCPSHCIPIELVIADIAGSSRCTLLAICGAQNTPACIKVRSINTHFAQIRVGGTFGTHSTSCDAWCSKICASRACASRSEGIASLANARCSLCLGIGCCAGAAFGCTGARSIGRFFLCTVFKATPSTSRAL